MATRDNQIAYYIGKLRRHFMAPMTDGQVIVGQNGEAPENKTISGDATLSKEGVLTLAALASFLAATVAGRARMANGFFDEATATLKFAAGAITGALLKAATVTVDKLSAAVQLSLLRVYDPGVVPCFELLMANQSSDHDTVSIGSDVYEFLTAGGTKIVTADTNIAVMIGAAAADTRANLIAAINGTAANPSATGLLIGGLLPAIGIGSKSLLADQNGTRVRCRNAAAQGGAVAGGNPSLVLAENITDAADVWGCGNVNVNSLGGRAAGERQVAKAVVVITATMITNTHRIELPFTPVGYLVQVRTAAGAIRGTTATSDTYAISGDAILCTFGGGAAPNLQANDVLEVTAWSA